jgi:hypothetical protein
VGQRCSWSIEPTFARSGLAVVFHAHGWQTSSFAKTGDIFKATMRARTIADYLRGTQLPTGNDSKPTSGSPGIASSLRRHWAEC